MAALPAEFELKMKELLGEEYESYLESFRAERVYGLRVNTLKISVEDFLKICPFEVKPVPWTHNGFYYRGSDKPAKHPYYFAGLYYLQEPSAMTPAEILPVEEGDFVLDTCAAPGGKSTELASKLNGKGVLFSNDISNSRAQALLKNLELFGVKNTVILSEDPQKLEPQFREYFDKILIDAPCSGEGMFRKEPAVIKSWVEHGNEFYVNLQKQITKKALSMLKPGGMMVYSTCTFAPCEDEDMILYMKDLCPELKVLDIPNRYGGFSEGMPEKAVRYDEELKKCIRIFPHKVDGEGHFVALLQKGEAAETERDSKNKKADISRLPLELREFLSMVSMPFENGSFEIRNEKVYFVPDTGAAFTGLRVMRSGLLIGEMKKKRFEPSQAFAMALKEAEFSNIVSLPASDPRVLKYLKGETVDVSDVFTGNDGWVLFAVDHFPLGFAKAARGILKNKYLAGWRYQ